MLSLGVDDVGPGKKVYVFFSFFFFSNWFVFAFFYIYISTVLVVHGWCPESRLGSNQSITIVLSPPPPFHNYYQLAQLPTASSRAQSLCVNKPRTIAHAIHVPR